jgi:hypothetical protein
LDADVINPTVMAAVDSPEPGGPTIMELADLLIPLDRHENHWLPGNENVHRRPPGTKSGSRFTAVVLPKSSKLFRENQMFIVIVGGVPHEILSTMAEPVLI